MITSRKLAHMMVRTADVAICPDTRDVFWSEFSRADELIGAGVKSPYLRLSPAVQTKIRDKGLFFQKPHQMTLCGM